MRREGSGRLLRESRCRKRYRGGKRGFLRGPASGGSLEGPRLLRLGMAYGLGRSYCLARRDEGTKGLDRGSCGLGWPMASVEAIVSHEDTKARRD